MAYLLNGTTQRIFVAGAPVTTSPWTINFWFRTTNMSQVKCLIALNNSGNNNVYATVYFRGDLPGDPIQILNQGGSSQFNATTTSGCTSNTWHNACYVESSSSSRIIYLDGGSATINTTAANYSGLNSLNIGAFNAIENFSGEIAEVGLWNTALTAPEIASLSKGMTCDKIRPQSLVFYAPLVRDLIDQRGGRTITNNNGATVANHPRIYP
jgi:hypothetical protein